MMVVGAQGSAVVPSGQQHGDLASQGVAGGRRLTVDIQFVVACEEADPDDYHDDAER